MYGNVIYFILVLLIYTTYYPPEKPFVGPIETVVIFLVLLAVFVVTTRAAFYNLSKKIDLQGPVGLHRSFDRLFNRQTIMAVIIFSLNIYVLNLKLFFIHLPLFSASPTLIALLFVGLFGTYLTIIWATAYDAYSRLFQTRISKTSYVLSNISFNFPVILPWLIISAALDIINLLPFETPKNLLSRPEGQVVFFSCFLAVLVVVGPSLIKSFWQCRPLPQGPGRKQIEAMCQRASMGYNNILEWGIFEGKLLTAGVMGLVKRFRYILVTKSLIQILDDDEMDAVMAHEIGHVKKKHLVFYLIFLLGFIVLSYAVFDLLLYAILYGNLAFPFMRDPRAEPLALTSILFTVAMTATLLVYFRYVFGYFMRNCERQADLYAFDLLGTSLGLVSSLQKIAAYSGQSHDRPSWHHFSIRQRIDFLNKCETDRSWIGRHNRKLQRSMVAFMAGLLVMGYLGYAINSGEMGKTLNRHFFEKVLAKKLERNPTNATLHSMLASIHYQNEAYAQAIEAYEKSIGLEPQNPEALNNLAWLYATCEQIKYRHPTKALAYAQQSALLKPVPHILDTLAESYYVNGFHEEAIITIKQALAMREDDEEYYQGQLRKFQQARNRKLGL